MVRKRATKACRLSQTNKPYCKRCGKCCYFLALNGDWLPCRYLIQCSTGFSTCTRYHKRIGTYVGNGQYCGFRKDYRFNIAGCPYNTPGKPIHPKFNK